MFLERGILPGDQFYEDINPYLKRWLFEAWAYKREREYTEKRSLAILVGSFHNPEAAQKMVKDENPDVSITSDEWEQSSEMLLTELPKEKKSRRKRKIIE